MLRHDVFKSILDINAVLYNASSERGFVVQVKPKRKNRRFAWPYVRPAWA